MNNWQLKGKITFTPLAMAQVFTKKLIHDFKGSSIKSYKRHPFMALVQTGQKTGVVQLPLAVSTWKCLVNLKQKDLFLSKTFKEFG